MLKYLTLFIVTLALIVGGKQAWASPGHHHKKNHYKHHGHHKYHGHPKHHYKNRSNVSVSLNFGHRDPYYRHYRAPYYPQRYQSVHYIINQPAPVLLQEPAYYTRSGDYCREYQSQTYIGGALQQSYGTACYQPDGSWKIIN